MNLKLTDREIATILHGLRLIQFQGDGRIDTCAAGNCGHFDRHEPLSNNEIDDLYAALTADFDADRYTNSFLCLKDSTRWDEERSPSARSALCPTCGSKTPPFATFDNLGQEQKIHDQDIYARANVIREKGEQRWDGYAPNERARIVSAACALAAKRIKARTRQKMLYGKWDGLGKDMQRLLLTVDWPHLSAVE